MKKTACLLAFLLAHIGLALAQVSVEVIMDQTEFLSHEAIPVAVRISNNSGQPLRFGKDDWLNYLVEARSGYVVEKYTDPPMAHDFELGTSEVGMQRSELSPYFNLSRSGHYTLTASVKLADWGAEVTSKPVGFDVIQGIKLWEQAFGMPSSSPTNHEPPEIRKYILQKADYLKHITLYFRLTDESESQVFRVVPIGPMTSYSQTQTLLDTQNNLHLLYEESARTYSYSVINPDGVLITRQQYYYTDAPPRLKPDDRGGVLVSGGLRHPTAADVPTARESAATATNSVPPPKVQP